MSRDINATLLAETVKPELNPIFALEFEADSGFVRAWTGIGEIEINSNTFSGTGVFGGFSNVEEGTDGTALGISYSLSGIDPAVAEIAVAEIRQDKIATLYFGAMNDNGELEGTPEPIAVHFTDIPTIQDDGETSTISLSCESAAIDQLRARIRRWTTEDQKIDHPTDTGFRYVEGMQYRKINFGRV